MSTHNIGFYENLTKINFQLHVSLNIIKYAPYDTCIKGTSKRIVEVHVYLVFTVNMTL